MVTPSPDEHDGVWLIACTQYEDADSDSSDLPRMRSDLDPIRQLGAPEEREIRHATKLLLWLASGAPYWSLYLESGQVFNSMRALPKVWSEQRAYPSGHIRRLRSDFTSWLACFGAFVDQSTHFVSQTFGEEAKKRFTRDLSRQYDAHVEYRLASVLRNAGLHQGEVINVVEMKKNESGVDCFIGFDGPKLAQEFPKMNAKVRRELKSLSSPVGLEAVVLTSLQCCERAQAALTLDVADAASAACGVLEALHDEAVDVGATAAQIGSSPRALAADGRMTFSWVRIEAAWAVREHIANARELLSR